MTAPWSTQPITGAQHDAWMAEERQRLLYPSWVQNAQLMNDLFREVCPGELTLGESQALAYVQAKALAEHDRLSNVPDLWDHDHVVRREASRVFTDERLAAEQAKYPNWVVPVGSGGTLHIPGPGSYETTDGAVIMNEITIELP